MGNHVYWNEQDGVDVMTAVENERQKLLGALEREIDETGMDIPQDRRRDPHWLARNAGIRNPVGEKFRKLLADYAKVPGAGTEEDR